jgi:hypothetical protein
MREGSLDAHCNDPRHWDGQTRCKADRSTRPKDPESIYGRPGAFHLAWLEYGKKCLTREEHIAAIPRKTRATNKEAQDALDVKAREERRDWMKKTPRMKAVLEAERPQRAAAGEPEEQPHL